MGDVIDRLFVVEHLIPFSPLIRQARGTETLTYLDSHRAKERYRVNHRVMISIRLSIDKINYLYFYFSMYQTGDHGTTGFLIRTFNVKGYP